MTPFPSRIVHHDPTCPVCTTHAPTLVVQAGPLPKAYLNPNYTKGRYTGPADEVRDGGPHGHHWYHGTSYDPHEDADDWDDDETRKTRDFGGDLQAPETSGSEYGERANKHWNTDLGVHFSSHHHVARNEFAVQRGVSPTSRVAHASLHMRNPIHFDDEHEFAHHATTWAHGAGHRYLPENAQAHKSFIDEEYEDVGDHDAEEGKHRDYEYHQHLPIYARDRKRISEIDQDGPDHHDQMAHERWLGMHPDREDITSGYRDHLKSMGHDGIVYGNTYEGPHGHPCAIAFPTTPVHIKKWEWLDEDHPSNQPAPRKPRKKRPKPEDPNQLKLFGARSGDSLSFEADEERNGGTKRPITVTLKGIHPEHGEVGFLRYHVPKRKADKIYVDQLKVDQEHRGNGYAGQLMDAMQERHPKTPIDHGTRTDDGKSWWKSYTKGKSVSKGRTAAAERPPVLRHEDLDRHISGYEEMGPVDRSHQPYLFGAQFHFHPSFPLERLDHYPAPPEELAEDDEQEEHYHGLQHAIMHRPHDVPPIIVVQHPTHHQILDGNHRVSLALDADVSHLPAYVYPHNPGKTAAAEPFTFDYAHRPQQTANYGATYGQDVEPHGRYLTVRHPSGKYPEDLYETGTHTFQNPKHMDFGGGYTDPSNWKYQLSKEFGGKRGRALSKAVVKAGHDGIVTHDEDGISEIVDLTGFHRTAERTVNCSNCKGEGHWFYNDRRVECPRCDSSGKVQAADHWDPPNLTPEHAQVLDTKDHGQYRRKALDLAKNVPAGTHVWRGETRHKDDLERPPSVGMHWTVKPEMVIFGNHGVVPEDHHQVVWQGVVDHPAEQTIPRTHPIWRGRHQSLDTEAEVRFRPGAQVRLNRRFVHDGDDRGSYLSPRKSEHSSPGWSAHDMDHHTEIAHNRPGGELMQYQKHYPDLFGGDTSTKDDSSKPTYYHGTHEEHRRFIHPDPDIDQTHLITTTDKEHAWYRAMRAAQVHGGSPRVYEVTHRFPRVGPVEKISEHAQRTPNGLNVVKEHHDMPDYVRDMSKEGERRTAARHPGFEGWHRLNDEGEEHGLTDREYEAFTNYTDGDNDDLNNWHRGRKPTYMDFSNPADLNKLHGMTKNIDRVADRFATDRPTTVYRTAPVGQVREGDILHDKGYMSTTEHRRVAEGYTGPDHTMMQIHLPAGTHAIPHSRLMRYSGAPGEVILPRNTHVRVTGVHPDHVEAEWHDPTGQHTAAKAWMPSARIFGPTHGLDHRLFDGDHLKPDVRDYILSTLGGFWAPLYGPNWRQWAKVYFAGSEASEWTSETLEGNDDFDVLIGVDYGKMRADLASLPGMGKLLGMMTDEQITNGMNTQFRDGLNPRTAKVMISIEGTPEGPFENTWFVNPNSYDIRNIRPYAAYDVTADTWAVKPPSLPDWGIAKFPEGKGLTQEIHGIIEMAKGVLAMPEPYRTQNGRALWEFVHSNRSDAFGPQGEGWYDSRNVIEKALDQAGLMQKLWAVMDKARQDPHALDAPVGWSNSPFGST